MPMWIISHRPILNVEYVTRYYSFVEPAIGGFDASIIKYGGSDPPRTTRDWQAHVYETPAAALQAAEAMVQTSFPHACNAECLTHEIPDRRDAPSAI